MQYIALLKKKKKSIIPKKIMQVVKHRQLKDKH